VTVSAAIGLLDAAGLRARLRDADLVAPARDPLGEGRGDGADAVGTRLAAVLVPFVLGPAPSVLLTKRAAHLSAHAGQVSFPGGGIEPRDASPEEAALREAEEEIGLDPRRVELLGRLVDHFTGTGYRITPVVGLLTPGLSLDALGLRPSDDEVEAIFELPLAVLLDRAAPQRRQATIGGRARSFWVWPHPEHQIWGATAAILVTLAARLRGDN